MNGGRFASTKTASQRFFEKVVKLSVVTSPSVTSPCWLWVGAKRSGRGHLWFDGSMKSAAKISLLVHGVAIPEGRIICHHCDNPPCVNPDHLFAGTSHDNTMDMVKKGRHNNARKTHCVRGHEFNEENTYNYRGKRQCKICQKIVHGAKTL